VNTRPPAIAVGKEEVYELEQILKHKGDGPTLKFYIHWKGYPPEEATWVPVENLRNCIETIRKYELEHNIKFKLVFKQGNVSQVPKPNIHTRVKDSVSKPNSSSTTPTSFHTNVKPSNPVPLRRSTRIDSKASNVQTTQFNCNAGQTRRACAACTHHKPQGTRCKRTTCMYGPTCWQHTPNLVIKKSNIPQAGKGLFTNSRTTINKGQNVISYTGDILNEQQFKQRYPDEKQAQYIYKVKNDTYIDAVKSNAGIGRYANTLPRKNNSRFTNNPRSITPQVNIKATKRIPPNTEILIPYGNRYQIYT
jgi:hypothetical protein